MTTNGFEQAVAILRTEREAAVATLRQAQVNLKAAEAAYAKIDGALNMLTKEDSEEATPTVRRASVHLGGGGTLTVGGTPESKLPPELRPKSVRALVQEVLEAEPRWFTTDEIFNLVVHQADKPADKVRHNVRSSIWSLRKKGDLVSSEDSSMHRAAVWTQYPEEPSVESTEGHLGSEATTS